MSGEVKTSEVVEQAKETTPAKKFFKHSKTS